MIITSIMSDDDQEIYAAPQESAIQSNFAQIRKAFEQKNSVPIKLAKDGRHQSKTPPKPVAPKPSPFKPQTSQKPKLFDDNAKPSLPAKVAKLAKAATESASVSPPPVLSPKQLSPRSLEEVKLKPTRRPSERDSVFPPGEFMEPSLQDRKQPLRPINGMNLPLKAEQTIVVNSPHGEYKKLALPPIGKGPPPKPAKLPASTIALPGDQNVTSATHYDDDDDGEIYDDVATPMTDFPPPPPDMMRPVSLIPEMTEDEEISDDEQRPAKSPSYLPPKLPDRAPSADDDQEVYDDVVAQEAEPEQEEIYEDI